MNKQIYIGLIGWLGFAVTAAIAVWNLDRQSKTTPLLVNQLVSTNQNQPNFEYPLNSLINMEVISHLGNPILTADFVEEPTKLVSVTHKISFDNQNKEYVYNYHVTYQGKERCFLSWGLIDKVIKISSIKFSAESSPLDSNTFPNMVELVPGETKDFVLRCKDSPYFAKETAFIYKRQDGGIWEFIPLDAQPGPLPFEKTVSALK